MKKWKKSSSEDSNGNPFKWTQLVGRSVADELDMFKKARAYEKTPLGRIEKVLSNLDSSLHKSIKDISNWFDQKRFEYSRQKRLRILEKEHEMKIKQIEDSWDSSCEKVYGFLKRGRDIATLPTRIFG